MVQRMRGQVPIPDLPEDDSEPTDSVRTPPIPRNYTPEQQRHLREASERLAARTPGTSGTDVPRTELFPPGRNEQNPLTPPRGDQRETRRQSPLPPRHTPPKPTVPQPVVPPLYPSDLDLGSLEGRNRMAQQISLDAERLRAARRAYGDYRLRPSPPDTQDSERLPY